MNQPTVFSPREIALGFVGAAVGAALGVMLFGWILKQGFYAMILPGTLLGLGFSLLSRHRHRATASICALLAVTVGLVTEWSHFAFIKDNSLTYFLMHVHQLKPITLLMIGIGAFLAYLPVAGSRSSE